MSTDNLETPLERDAVFAILTGVFRDVFQDDAIVISDATTAADIPLWDSLSNILMVLAVERAFMIRLTAAQVANLKDVGSFATVIQAKLKS